MSELVLKQPRDIGELLKRRRIDLIERLPGHVKPEKIITSVVMAAAENKAILRCKPESILRAAYNAAEVGLECHGVLGEGYLVPYRDECQFIPGYRGLLSLAHRSGQFTEFFAEAVYEGDRFRVQLGTDPKIEHVPEYDNRGEFTHFYAVARSRGGDCQFAVLTLEEVQDVQKSSSGYLAFRAGKIRTTPWESNFAEMGKKTAIRRLFKMLPLSSEILKTAVALSDQEYRPEAVTVGNGSSASSRAVASVIEAPQGEIVDAEAERVAVDAEVPENGADAFIAGVPPEANPFEPGSEKAAFWDSDYAAEADK